MNNFNLGIGNKADVINLRTILPQEPGGYYWDRSTDLYYLDERYTYKSVRCARIER